MVATTVAKEDAEYSLFAPDKLTSWIQTDVPKGSAVGFRQEPDGSVVAFAGEQTWRVEDSNGRHVWLCTPKPVTGWDKFLVRSRDKAENAFGATLLILAAPFWIPACAVTDEWP
jgi:hypothetical protein